LIKYSELDLQRANEAPPPGPSTMIPARIALGCGNFGGVGSAPAFVGQGPDEDLGNERIAQIVIGPGRPEHLQPVAEAIEHPLTVDERARLGEAFG
jgi:hypothetical protein